MVIIEKKKIEGELAEKLMFLSSKDNLLCGKLKYATAWNLEAFEQQSGTQEIIMTSSALVDESHSMCVYDKWAWTKA